ncbi:MAG: hypothetical protein R3B69_00405 [Candidatus Paceibacterota bacterium]
MTQVLGTLLTLSGNDLNSVTIAGAADAVVTDTSAALLGDLTIVTGSFTAASGTLSVGGSFDATGGLFNHSSELYSLIRQTLVKW